jgi:hypothetical protein
MTINPDDVVVLCSLVEDGPSSVSGSTKETCYQCQKQVWLSPATRRTVERESKDYKVLCIPCGQQRLRDNPSPDDKLMPPSPEQWGEIFKGLLEAPDDNLVPPSPEQLRQLFKELTERN